MPKFLLLLASFLILSCGGKGTGGGSATPENKSPQPGDNQGDQDGDLGALETGANFSLARSRLPDWPDCENKVSPHLIISKSDIAIDGNFEDWNGVASTAVQGSRSVTATFKQALIAPDAGYSGLIQVDEGSIDFVTMQMGALEYGENRGKVTWSRFYRFGTAKKIERLDAAGGVLPLRLGEVAEMGDSAVEWYLPRAYVDGVVLRPVWFTRYTIALKSGEKIEVGPTLGKTLVEGGSTFSFSNCARLRPTDGNHFFGVTSDSSVDAAIKKTAIGMIRWAFESVYDAFKRMKPPASQTSIVFLQDNALVAPYNFSVNLRHQALNDVVVVSLPDIEKMQSLEEWGQFLFERFVARYSAQYLRSLFAEADPLVLEALGQSIVDEIVLAKMGPLDFFKHQFRWTKKYVSSEDLAKLNITKIDRHPFEAGQQSDLIPPNLAPYLAKARAIGRSFRIEKINDSENSPIWQRVLVPREEGGFYPSTIQTFSDLFQDFESTGILRTAKVNVFSSWLEAEQKESYANIGIVRDGDGDGLPAWFEKALASSDEKRDSDGDGWTDLSEYMMETDLTDGSQRPETLFEDGSFGDWQDLLPSRVQPESRAAATECTGGGDITTTVGIRRDEFLMLSARNKDGGKRDWLTEWRIEIELVWPEEVKQQFSLNTIEGSRVLRLATKVGESEVNYNFPRAFSNSDKAVELVLDFGKIAVAKPYKDIIKWRYRFQTFKKDPNNVETLLCDETGWNQPLFHQ